MTRRLAFAAAFALALVAPAALAAQTCQGYASFSNGNVQLGAAASFADSSTVYGIGIGFGAASGGFINGQIGRASVEVDGGDDATATLFGINGGWQLPLGTPTATRAVQLCPVAGFNRMSGDYDEGGVSADYSENVFSFGGALGLAFTASPALTVVPYTSITWNTSSGEFDSDIIAFDTDAKYGAMDLGVGFVANEWITVRPSVAFSFAESGEIDGVEVDDVDGETVYTISFAFNFGRSSR